MANNSLAILCREPGQDTAGWITSGEERDIAWEASISSLSSRVTAGTTVATIVSPTELVGAEHVVEASPERQDQDAAYLIPRIGCLQGTLSSGLSTRRAALAPSRCWWQAEAEHEDRDLERRAWLRAYTVDHLALERLVSQALVSLWGTFDVSAALATVVARAGVMMLTFESRKPVHCVFESLDWEPYPLWARHSQIAPAAAPPDWPLIEADDSALLAMDEAIQAEEAALESEYSRHRVSRRRVRE